MSASSLRTITFLNSVVPKDFGTKIAIFLALDELSKHKEYCKITVRDIYEAAHVSKSTFYAHFQNKHSIMQWHCGMVHDAGINQAGRTLSLKDGYELTTSGISTSLSLYEAAGKSTEYDSLVPYGIRKRCQAIQVTLTEYRHVTITEKLQYQINALTAFERAATEMFFSQPIPLELFSEYMVSCVPNDLREALKYDTENDIDQNPWHRLYYAASHLPEKSD